MATALQQYKQKITAMQRVAEHRQVVQRAVHVAEIGTGAVAGGFLDARMPEIMGAPTSLLTGVAFTVAGVALAMPHISSVGVGMVIPHLYKVGQDFGAPS